MNDSQLEAMVDGVIDFRFSPSPEWLRRALDRTEYEIAAE